MPIMKLLLKQSHSAPVIGTASRANLRRGSRWWSLTLVFVSLYCLTGCGFTGSTSSASAKLAPEEGLKLISNSEPYVYQILDSELTFPVFVTAIEECGGSKRELKASLSRQLLVGFDDIRIVWSKLIYNSSGEMLETLAQAEVEEMAVSVLSYLSVNNKCSKDTVFWSNHPEPEQLKSELSHSTVRYILTGEK